MNVLGVPWGGLRQPTLIRFDDLVGSGPNQIPEDAVITSARLELYKTGTQGNIADYQIYVHQMLCDWNTGTAVDLPQEGSTCYQYRTYSRSKPEIWGTEETQAEDERPIRHVDFIQNPYLASLPIGPETNVWMPFDVTKVVQNWVSGKAANYGLLVRAGGYWVGATFFSSEARNQEYRPRLVVDYVMKEDIKYTASDNWKLHFVPATLNEDKTINLIPGYTQSLSIKLQAEKEVTTSANVHEIELEFDFPGKVKIIDITGQLEVIDTDVVDVENRKKIIFACIAKNNNINGAPSTRLVSEGSALSLAINIPEEIPIQDRYLYATIRHNGTYRTEKWDLALVDLAQKGGKLKNTRIGLWDYGMNYTDSGTEEIGLFLTDMGVNHIQKGAQGYKGYKKSGLTTGGYIHHSVFYNNKFSDYNAHGKPITGSFCDPQAVINSNGAILNTAIERIVSVARNEDLMATFDFEPTGQHGFSEASIAEFKKQYKVSDAEFQELQALIKNYGMQAYRVEDERKELYHKWVEFRTWQTSNFIRIINEKVKELEPECRIHVTTRATCKDHHPTTLAIGVDSSAMGQYVDAIMPQVYSGYGGVETKNTILKVKAWRENVENTLYPILLIRYSGATVKNSPARVRQQVIGSIAEGADGVYFYYPQLMDGLYWAELARTTKEIEYVEDFYKKGSRCEDLLELKGMPLGTSQIFLYPSVTVNIENPDWHFTAHTLDDLYCVTLFNLKDANDLVFTLASKDTFKVKEIIGGSITKDETNEKGFLVSPQNVAFVILKKTSR